jgi:serine protease Do
MHCAGDASRGITAVNLGDLMFRILIACLALSVLLIANSRAFSRTLDKDDTNAVHKAIPAVVNIAVWKVRKAATGSDAARRVKAYGSGFIVDPTGIIVTNKHVIDGAIDISVILGNGDRYHGTLLAVAAMLDLALVKVEVDHPLPVLKWGDSDALQVGDPVLTIGNALGIGISVSAGIVSALNRDIQDTPFDQYIQTDAAINHGNSGGPLVDTDGEVVGVDTALYNPEESGGFIGIGFAIPADTAKFVVHQLLDPSHPKPGWLGVTLQDLTPELAEALGLNVRGSLIAVVDADGPADKAGLRTGDVLTAIGDATPGDSRAFMRAIVQIPVGKVVPIRFWRNGQAMNLEATIAEWPNVMPEGGMMSERMAAAMIQKMPDPGVRLAPLTDEARKQYGLDPRLDGALVASVEKDCEARDLGIVPGDVVTAVQGAPVATPDDVRRAVQTAHDQRRPYLAVLVQGKSGTRWVSLSIGSGRH